MTFVLVRNMTSKFSLNSVILFNSSNVPCVKNENMYVTYKDIDRFAKSLPRAFKIINQFRHHTDVRRIYY